VIDALKGGISDLFGEVLESIYLEAMLIKIVDSHATNGDVTRTAFGHDCFHHPVSRSEFYRASAGLADKEVEVIVLASHIPGVAIDTDDEIVSDSANYSVVRAKLDGAKSQWKCVCKEKTNG
jgi:hypothetical protein